MFTGIIQARGAIARVEEKSGDRRIAINTGKLPLDDVQIGDSIAVSGVCLTVVSLDQHMFNADVSRETIARTILASAEVGMPVNLEMAVLPSTRLGGHIVSGHVDGIGLIQARQNDGRSVRFIVKTPDQLAKYIAEKGSICIDGISLTVNQVDGVLFDVNIVPHTLKETTLGEANRGQRVNLEVDLLARYIERLMRGEQAARKSSDLFENLLKECGFIEDAR